MCVYIVLVQEQHYYTNPRRNVYFLVSPRPMPVLKRKLSNPFNMNGNNSNRSTSSLHLDLNEVEKLVGLLASPTSEVVERCESVGGGLAKQSTRSRKNSAPTEMATVVAERRTARTSRFNLGGGGRRNAASPTTPKKKKSQQVSTDKKSGLEK